MIRVQVELDKTKGMDEDPTFTLTIEDKDSMLGFFKSDGLKISEIDQVYKDIYTKLKDAKEHYRWLMTK